MLASYLGLWRNLHRDNSIGTKQLSNFIWLSFLVGLPLCKFRVNTSTVLNTLRPRQNGRHFLDDIFNWIFFNENVLIPITISLKFVPKDPMTNIPALVQKMAWRRPGDKPLSEPMMVKLLMLICVTRPQWVNSGIVPSILRQTELAFKSRQLH